MKTFSFVKIFIKNIRKCETIETQSKAKAVEEKKWLFSLFSSPSFDLLQQKYFWRENGRKKNVRTRDD